MNDSRKFTIKSRIWINTEDGPFLGEGRVELLRKIHETGSMAKAAKSMNMSYKKAWGLVNSMNMQFPKALVIRTTGGLNGGGSILSESGKMLLDLFTQLNENNKLYLQNELNKLDFLK